MAAADPFGGPLAPPPGARDLIEPELLRSEKDLLTALKQGLTHLDNSIAARFEAGAEVRQLVQARAWGVERLLLHAWQSLMGSGQNMALIAVGGFGRGQLHPHSDVDLLLLFERGELSAAQKQAIESLVSLLWDAGFYLGHSVRNLEQCRIDAAADVTTMTSLMEARLLAGPQFLLDAMRRAIDPAQMWSASQFFHAKLEEQKQRHEQYGETAYNLEPNVKEGPGGLRDIQMVDWVARRHFGAARLQSLVDYGFLTEGELQELMDGQQYLWRVRFALHVLAGRAEDRLLFDFQRQTAQWFGYRDKGDNNRAVEQFMQSYYRVVTRLERLNERLLQLFREELLGQSDPVIEPLGEGFCLRNGYLDLAEKKVFARRPEALMELFLLLAREQRIKGVRAATVRQIVDHLDLVDDDFRRNPVVLEGFMALLRQPRGVYTQLQRMNRYGFMAAFIPAFGQIVGRMQFDLFHVYTVDQHILFTVRNLRRFAYGKYRELYDHAPQVFARIERPFVLYLAALFHDIAKGRGGDHSELGSVDALEFCAHLPMRESDRKLVAWLVEHHLQMSQTAQKKDLGDPETIRQFAMHVDSRKRLDHLYLLTVADISATSPRLWNSWKAGLLWELYQSAAERFSQDHTEPVDRAEYILESRDEALSRLAGEPFEVGAIEALWERLPNSVFLRFSAGQLAWASTSVLSHASSDALVAARTRDDRNVTEVFVYAADYTGLFATVTAVMDEFGVDVLSARVITSSDNRSFDLFQIMDQHGQVLNQGDQSSLVQRLQQALAQQQVLQPVKRPMPRRLRPFMTPAEVHFRSARHGDLTEMEVECTDRPGLLSQLAAAMVSCEVQLHDAMIATFGDRVEDVFLLTDQANQPLGSQQQRRLAADIEQRLKQPEVPGR